MNKIAVTIVSTLLLTLGVSLTHVEAYPVDQQVVVGDNNNRMNGNNVGRNANLNLTRTAADNDYDVDYGWLGLLGLLGLAGLRGRDRSRA